MKTAAAVQPVIWKRCTTEIRPHIIKESKALCLYSETAKYKVKNNQGVACKIVTLPLKRNAYAVYVHPEIHSDNYNLFTIMLKRLENNVMEWNYWHTTSLGQWHGRTLSHNLIVLEINDLSTSSEKKMSDPEINALSHF